MASTVHEMASTVHEMASTVHEMVLTVHEMETGLVYTKLDNFRAWLQKP